MKREWKESMGEISGFGGGYEKTCRDMVLAGIEWLDAHPESDPKFHGYKNIYGIIMEDNDDARQLTKDVVDASNNAKRNEREPASVPLTLWFGAFVGGLPHGFHRKDVPR